MRTNIISFLRLFKTRLQIELCNHKQTNHSLFKSVNFYVYSVYCSKCGILLKQNNYTHDQWNNRIQDTKERLDL